MTEQARTEPTVAEYRAAARVAAHWGHSGNVETFNNYADQLEKWQSVDEKYVKHLTEAYQRIQARVHEWGIVRDSRDWVQEDWRKHRFEQDKRIIRDLLEQLRADGQLASGSVTAMQDRMRRNRDAVAKDERARDRIKLANKSVMAARERQAEPETWPTWQEVPEDVPYTEQSDPEGKNGHWINRGGKRYAVNADSSEYAGEISDSTMSRFAPFVRVREGQ